jgi:hypothetical protein
MSEIDIEELRRHGGLLMFRGVTDDTWATRLVLRGWPPEAAREMAGFLVGRIPTPPKWERLRGGQVSPLPEIHNEKLFD